jgi:hypothetical protein
MKVLGINDHYISDAQMRSMSAKTMVIVADADAVKPEHALAMFTLRGGGDEDAGSIGHAAEGSGRAPGDPAGDLTHRHPGRVRGTRADGACVPR